MKKILIMGLPGSGKTTLAQKLTQLLKSTRKSVIWINADTVRSLYNDWDFSYEGRMRQAKRLADLANVSDDDYTIVDFVAPTEEIRHIFNADITIWMDTIQESRYGDTNKVFQKPNNADLVISNFNYNIEDILQYINNFTINK
jgi:adenylylsulfate kinase